MLIAWDVAYIYQAISNYKTEKERRYNVEKQCF